MLERERVWFRGWFGASDMLQPYRRLAFEGDFAREAEYGSDSVKKSTHRGGRETSNIVLNELQGFLITRWEIERFGQEVRQTFKL